MTKRSTSLPVVVAVAVVALVVGSFGTAVAGPALTKATVRKIATKVVQKHAASLSVATAAHAADASTLGGRSASAYQDQSTVYTADLAGQASIASSITIPLAPGHYVVTYSVAMVNGSGRSGCYVHRLRPGPFGGSSIYTADDSTTGAHQAFSGSGLVDVVANDAVFLSCASEGAWSTSPNDPLEIVVTPVDTVTDGGTLTANP